jgi:hypothetical protein
MNSIVLRTARSVRRTGARASSGRVATLLELARCLVGGGRWWLLPFVVVMGLTSVLMVVVQVIEYFAPFVYTLF